MLPSLSLTIPGRPVPLKNSRQVDRYGRITLPSKSYQEYYQFCIGTKRQVGWLSQWGNIQFTGPVRVDAHYWLPDKRWWPDLTGLLQATGDILQAAGLITNDRNIVSWGTSRIMGLDKEKPRAEIAISEAEAPGWW